MPALDLVQTQDPSILHALSTQEMLVQAMTAATRARQELADRARRLGVERFLPVHYYRIRKRIAFPLPISDPLQVPYTLRGFSATYPWSIWLRWALENRMLALGYSACHADDRVARTGLESDLSALATMKTYRESDRPDLPYAHAVRVLWVAVTRWNWMPRTLRTTSHEALHRAVEDALPLSERLHGQFDSLASLLAVPRPHQHLHNIPLIGTCALALAAKAVAHPASGILDARVARLFTAVLTLRQGGFTEGVSYDGYVLSFVADWLSTLPASARDEILSHPSFTGLVEQVLELAAPGDVMNTAPLGDVEPMEMPFVWSALAVLQRWRPDARVVWAFSECDVSRLRSDALAALAHWPDHSPDAPAVRSPATLNYAVVLRTGYAADDLAVAIGLSSSPMAHIHFDSGSLVLGTRGRWWLDDPGYQQYLQTSERQFTVGLTAHNAPVINGHAQARKQPELVAASRLVDAPDVQFALVDLTACYPAGAGARRVRRAVWLLGNQHLVVCDLIATSAAASVAFHWHGHPSLYWCLQDESAIMVSEEDPDCWLHVFSPQLALGPADLHRLPGSRGQQTLMTTLYPPPEATVWWVFSFAAERPALRIADGSFMLGDREVPIDERVALPVTKLELLPRAAPLAVAATIEGGVVEARCVAGSGHFSGELEYAFYLLVGGKRALVQWYSSCPNVSFPVPIAGGGQPLEVRAFVREKANPERKVARTATVKRAG